MDSKKILSLLGFASKASKLQYGFNKSLESLKLDRSKLIVIAFDVSEKSSKEIKFFADKKSIQYITLGGIGIEALSKAVGRTCGIVSVNDKGFADACLNAFNEGGNA